MKFLDDTRLNAVTCFLDNCSVGERKLRGRVEAYSCKPAGDDKKLAKVLDKQYIEEFSQSPGSAHSFGASPIGELSDPHTRKLLINLICTMNATFPDYDFSTLKPDQFIKENLGVVVNSVNQSLSEIVEKQDPRFLEELWSSIDNVVLLKDSEVYKYVPDLEDDPFSTPGSMWSFNHFFHSPTEKKIVFFTCCCTTSSSHSDLYGSGMDDGSDASETGSERGNEEEEEGYDEVMGEDSDFGEFAGSLEL
mmetsp:Transcript_5250/g.8026  ORF Transcript_5250/g.8026 Transcript_5250/m.8026 type:complete len:249 (+) Transcript_5250:230-976(+)